VLIDYACQLCRARVLDSCIVTTGLFIERPVS